MNNIVNAENIVRYCNDFLAEIAKSKDELERFIIVFADCISDNDENYSPEVEIRNLYEYFVTSVNNFKNNPSVASDEVKNVFDYSFFSELFEPNSSVYEITVYNDMPKYVSLIYLSKIISRRYTYEGVKDVIVSCSTQYECVDNAFELVCNLYLSIWKEYTSYEKYQVNVYTEKMSFNSIVNKKITELYSENYGDRDVSEFYKYLSTVVDTYTVPVNGENKEDK